MPIWSNWRRGGPPSIEPPAEAAAPVRVEPTFASSPAASAQPAGGGVLITTPQELDEYLKTGSASMSGPSVTPSSAMKSPVVYGCVRLITGAVATMPMDIMRRVDHRTRVDASDTQLWKLMRRRPNRWQKPSQFKRYLQACVLLRGNAYCLIVRSRGEIVELLPLNPDRVETKQLDDLSIVHVYTRPDGGSVVLRQSEVFHLFGLSLDGYRGVTPITYARETIGLSLAMADHGAATFRNGARAAGALKHPQKLGAEGQALLKASLDDYRAGGASEGKYLILEEGMDFANMSMSAVDSQWIESRGFSRTDIMMFYGVPPHMLGVTEKSTSWGTGLESQKDGFVTFTLDDYLVMWEEGVSIDLAPSPDVYAKFNRNALVKGDIKARWASYVSALQWGVRSPNDVLALEDENPRPGGDVYYPPPNTAGDTTKNAENEGDNVDQNAS